MKNWNTFKRFVMMQNNILLAMRRKTLARKPESFLAGEKEVITLYRTQLLYKSFAYVVIPKW